MNMTQEQSHSNLFTCNTVLPIFPYPTNCHGEPFLLLANTPYDRLTNEQAEQRRIYGYHRPTMIPPIDDHQRQLFFLSRLWNIDRSILEWNFMRMMRIVHMIAIHRTYRFAIQSNGGYLCEDEYHLALEFYLQIDHDLFYMKTCGFRGALPINNEQNIFCFNAPQARYGLTPCQHTTCCLCYPSYQLTYRTNQSLIRFNQQQEHYFVHGYRSILNCPVTCETRNIIYALTCPCHKADYIGETSSSLPVRLSYHQQHGNRIIQEFLMGSKNTIKIRPESKSMETLVKDSMALYQHSTHCSFALQWFLDENPEYWPFIPVKIDDYQQQFIDNVSEEITSWIYANDIPKPPPGYYFTIQQKNDIESFFQQKKYLSSPNYRLDLYQAAFIAVLPMHTSANLRHMIESLLITHAQTSLNTDGHLNPITNSMSIPTQSTLDTLPLWCENLICRSLNKNTTPLS